MHYRSLNAVLEQYSSSLTHHPFSPNSLALHIGRQTQGYLKFYTLDGISLTYQDEPVFWSFFSHDLYDAYLIRSYAESWQAYQPVADGQAFQAVPSQRPSERPYSEAGIFSDDLQNTFSRPALQAFNQHYLGILRNDTDLRRAIAQLRLWKQNQAEPHTVSEYENRNLLECSLAVAQAAYRRRQNIGAYFNSDC